MSWVQIPPAAPVRRPSESLPLNLELDPLRQRQLTRPVDGDGLPAHVGLPGIAAGFAAATGIFFAAKSSADLGAARAYVDVGYSAVAAPSAQESLGRHEIRREHGRGESLRHVVVPRDNFVDRLELYQVENRSEH